MIHKLMKDDRFKIDYDLNTGRSKTK